MEVTVRIKASGLPRSILMMMLNDKDTGGATGTDVCKSCQLLPYRSIPGVGAKYLAGKDSETVTIIGPGVMGRTCLLAFLSVCPKITTVKCERKRTAFPACI